MKVYVPSALRSYTGQKDEVEVDGATLDELLRELDRRYPGFRFRIIDEQYSIRPHIKIFINHEQARELSAVLRAEDEVSILLGSAEGRIETVQSAPEVRANYFMEATRRLDSLRYILAKISVAKSARICG